MMHLWTTGDEWVGAQTARQALAFYEGHAGAHGFYMGAEWRQVPDDNLVRFRFETAADMPDFGKRCAGMLVEATAAQWAGQHDEPHFVAGMDF